MDEPNHKPSLFISIPFDNSVWERGASIDAWMTKLKLERIGSGAGGGERDLEYEAPDIETSKEIVIVLVQAFPWIIRVHWDDYEQYPGCSLLLFGKESDGF